MGLKNSTCWGIATDQRPHRRMFYTTNPSILCCGMSTPPPQLRTHVNMENDGGQRATDGCWRVTDGCWRVTDGCWRVTDGGRRVTDRWCIANINPHESILHACGEGRGNAREGVAPSSKTHTINHKLWSDRWVVIGGTGHGWDWI